MLDNLVPTSGRVLVERLTEEAKTETGILKPESALETLPQARVLAVAHDVEDVTVGDTVLLSAYPGQEMEIDGAACCFVLAEELLGVVE